MDYGANNTNAISSLPCFKYFFVHSRIFSVVLISVYIEFHNLPLSHTMFFLLRVIVSLSTAHDLEMLVSLILKVPDNDKRQFLRESNE